MNLHTIPITLLAALAAMTRVAAEPVTPAEARAIAKEAYIYGFPVVDSYRIQHACFVNPASPEYKAPWNQIKNMPRVFTPALLFPSASDDRLGGEQWAAGPTVVALKQSKGWTFGALVNHLWSYAGNDERADVNSMFLQPFVSFTTESATTFGLNTETAYNGDARHDHWSVPVNFTVAQLLKVGKQPLQLTGGVRYWAESPEGGPEG